MTTKEDIFNYVKEMQDRNGNDEEYFPIYSIFLFTNPDKEMIYENGDLPIHSGFPDIGASLNAGFYYDIDCAISAMNHNGCDIHEYCYNAGFVLCRFPGLYSACGQYSRMYFLWDEEKQGFFQKEEPEIFHHVAY